MKTKDIVTVALFTAVTVICAWITVPSAVPFTLQTFAVLLSCGLLGGKGGTVTVLLYLALGAVGLPVFSGFRGGVSVLFDAGGGFLLGFVLSALFMWATERYVKASTARLAVSMAAALLISYLSGALWYAMVYLGGTGDLIAVISVTILPFIIPDIAKLSLALYLTRRLKRFI